MSIPSAKGTSDVDWGRFAIGMVNEAVAVACILAPEPTGVTKAAAIVNAATGGMSIKGSNALPVINHAVGDTVDTIVNFFRGGIRP